MAFAISNASCRCILHKIGDITKSKRHIIAYTTASKLFQPSSLCNQTKNPIIATPIINCYVYLVNTFALIWIIL